jgi:hypothetical protein
MILILKLQIARFVWMIFHFEIPTMPLMKQMNIRGDGGMTHQESNIHDFIKHRYLDMGWFDLIFPMMQLEN